MVKNQLISVIIPTKNSRTTIDTCLRSIRNQTYPNIEIIVIDSFSADKTQKIAANYGARIIETGERRSKARNIGAEKAKGKVVFFVDSDMELDSAVVEECVKKVGEGYHAIIVPEVSIGQGFWAKCKALEKLCYIGDETIEAARFFERNAFEAINGYDIELEAGEDWDLSQRVKKAGFRVGRVCSLIRHHEGKLTIWETATQKYQYGKTLDKYKRKHPNEIKQQMKLIRPAFMRNWRRLVKDPLHAIGLMALKTFEFWAAGFGYLRNKFSFKMRSPASKVSLPQVEQKSLSFHEHTTVNTRFSLLFLASCLTHFLQTILGSRNARIVRSRIVATFVYPIWHLLYRGDNVYRSLSRTKLEGFSLFYRSKMLSDLIVLSPYYELYVKKVFTPQSGNVVVDVGAHIGLYTLLAASRVGDRGKILAIEPDPRNHEILVKNIVANELGNVVALKMALSDCEGQQMLFTSPDPLNSSFVQLRRSEPVRVVVTTLDNLLDRMKIPIVDWLKIDVESADFLVLKGANRALDTKVANIIIEATSKETLELLRRKGFKVKNLFSIYYHAQKGIEKAKQK